MSSYQYQHTTELEGVKISYDICEHCGALPTTKDIQAQLSLIRGIWNAPCVVCREHPKVVAIAIRHYKTRDADRWGGDVTLSENMGKISANFEGIQIDVWIHAKCMIEALPGARLQHRLCELEDSKNLT